MPSLPPNPKNTVPFHSLGISQIVAYGLLFYSFAQLKTPLALAVGVGETYILTAVSGALLTQALLAPIAGGWVDRYGGLPVMTVGFMIGAGAMAALPFATSLFWIWACLLPVGVASAMATYEVAFGAAVQMDESRARRNISFISFYGGVASSCAWLMLAPLLAVFGLNTACLVVAAILATASLWCFILSRRLRWQPSQTQTAPTPFSWRSMNRVERRAIVILASADFLEFFTFSSTTILLITWFSFQFDSGLAVILAAIYGPFQVVGRAAEMVFGHRFDARLTALVAFACLPLSFVLLQGAGLGFAITAMVFFGIGHGILTVSFGYVTNMYFRAEVYGRAKGWVSATRGLGNAIGPSIGGALFLFNTDLFFAVMMAGTIIGGVIFAQLLRLTPSNPIFRA